MSVHVLFNLSNVLRKRDKMGQVSNFISFFAMSLINSIKHEHKC